MGQAVSFNSSTSFSRDENLKTAIIIPARLGSTRLPRKMLLAETGKTLIEHTYEAATRCKQAERVIVATDDQEIITVVQGFGGEAVLTKKEHLSGTDRVAEAAAPLTDFDLIVNLQGDEPEIDPKCVDDVIELLASNQDVHVGTVACPIRERTMLNDPACVKVVMDHAGRALYFSRSCIPHARNWHPDLLQTEPAIFWQHLGIYVYRREFLLRFSALPKSRLEGVEMLEQLRVLQAGAEILVATANCTGKGIDTLDDYRAFVSRHSNC